MPKRYRSANETPLLILGQGPPWETHGIFSDHFVRTRLNEVASWPKQDEKIKPSYEYLLDLWHRRHVGFEKANEETTCREFLEPVLSKLGFSCLYQLDVPVSSSRLTPDYLLFPDEQTKDRVFNADPSAKYQAAIALLEAKKVGHALDQVSKSEQRFPHQQVREYLQAAADSIGVPYFRWGILTNGNYWRLYCRDAHPGAYFEFHLAGPNTNFCSFEEFKTFVALFSALAFVKTDGVCLLDEIRNEAIQFQADLEESIRRRVTIVVKDLANGFWSFKENGLKEENLRDLYDSCLILLYRLLFVLHAEGRGLLPVKLAGPGSNINYRERYSLSRLVRKLQSPDEFHNDEFTDLYDELRKLFHLINGDRPTANKACGVPLYNGGLFDRKAHPLLEGWRIGDKSLANVLRDLIFTAGASQRAKQREFEWGAIDYADLEVRQLGDIYEGLLGGHLEPSRDPSQPNELAVMGERAELQLSGTFYTPDWVVRFLVEKTLRPLIDEIEACPAVQKSRNVGKKDNSFAREVLKLNVLDPAMGSGHFLVRATEWLADEIVYHPSTEFQIKEIPRGLSQEQAEISYWRRRVVEACIYGVDKNPLAVELAKLSLWLTCIASEEPLNFLDHHLRSGNSLIGAKVSELSSLLAVAKNEREEEPQVSLSLWTDFSPAVGAAIHEIAAIEGERSDKLENVKDKERRWNDLVLPKLRRFRQIANLWTASLAGLPLTQLDYCHLGQLILSSETATPKGRKELAGALEPIESQLSKLVTAIKPFHWELEFPDVFFQEDGARRANAGFDAVLGNPPYISTQTSSEFDYRAALEPRFGYADDLYVHFVDQGFKLLREGGRFGFIISDTFLTLATKLRVREILQANRLDYLVQCDPFRATVDAAMFVAQKGGSEQKQPGKLTFIQARHSTRGSKPDVEVSKLLDSEPKGLQGEISFLSNSDSFPVTHAQKGCLRVHRTLVEPYRRALKRAFFEPTEAIIRLYNRFNSPMKSLVAEWWDKIETSKKFSENRSAIIAYEKKLKLREITLVGLIAEGGQGMRTANNGRFLGYLEGTPQANEAVERRRQLSTAWEKHPRVGPIFKEILGKHNGDFESVVEHLKQQFDWRRDLGLRKGEVYRIVSASRLATQDEFERAFEFRKAELQKLWSETTEVAEWYDQLHKEHNGDFFKVYAGLVEEAVRRSMASAKLGLRSGETYDDPDDAPRIAAIYSGLVGQRTWVPFRKGDPEGNKWATAEPLFIDWNENLVGWLWNHSGRPEANMPVIRNAHLYFTSGVTWTLHANHVGLKARWQPDCIFDASGSRLTPIGHAVSANQFLAILNADLFSFIIKKLIKNTQDYEINDLRMAPIVIPGRSQAKELETLATWAIKAKELSLNNSEPSVELVTFCKELAENQISAPRYLQPNPQLLLLHTADDCLAIIELAVNWAVERLYGVEGFGPFDEF
jgi:hypothetical protein